MAESVIPVDPFNPGQVFACLGLAELAEVLLGGAQAGFDWSGPEMRFVLRARGEASPIGEALRFLAGADVVTVAPQGSGFDTLKWQVSTEAARDDIFPIPLPDSPATLPVILRRGEVEVLLSSWGERDRDNLKFWAGSGGYPGAGLVRDTLALLPRNPANAARDPFNFAAPQSSSFRFDWRRDYIPLDAGFSPNAHSAVVMTGYPAVEILAAIGVSHARPRRERKLLYRYAVPGITDGSLYPLAFLRAALGAPDPFIPGVPLCRFRMSLNWPGQEGQARAITDVVEETVT